MAAGLKCALFVTSACRFFGCGRRECLLCKNNPNKTCQQGDNFDSAYADSQVLKAKCGAEIYVEVVNKLTGEPTHVPGVDIQVSMSGGLIH
jgi:hypothetical protein